MRHAHLPSSRPARRRRFLTAVGVLVASASLLGACRVNSSNIAAADKLPAGSPAKMTPSKANVAYGADPAQKIDVYRATGGQRAGTIVYFHAGGWVAGDRTDTSALMLAERARGWDVVSVEYRLAPTVRAPQVLADANRAMRYVRANGSTLGINTNRVVAAGESAGGHLAAMMGVAPDVSVDPNLPANLKAVPARADAVIDLVGPADLTTFWKAGGWGPGLVAQFLGCTMGGDIGAASVSGPCPNADLANRYSPVWWAQLAAYFKGQLPPAYLAYGPNDTLVIPATQGDPLYEAWRQAGGDNKVWYETPEGGDHNLDFNINKTLFDSWLDKVRDNSF